MHGTWPKVPQRQAAEMTASTSVEVRGIADLRGTAAHAGRSRRVTQPLRRAGRRRARADAAIGPLDQAVENARLADRHLATVTDQATGVEEPPLKVRTVNVLIGVMAAADIALVAEALLVAGQVSSPLHATLLATGLGISLVGLGKKAGHTIATFERLHDESAKWGSLIAIAVLIALVAPVGLTLLRAGSIAAWPFLAAAVPIGSAALTWLTHSPLRLALERARRNRVTMRRRLHRRDLHVMNQLTTSIANREVAEIRFRSLVGSAMRRCVLDGSLPRLDLGAQHSVLDALVLEHMLAPQTSAVRDRRDAAWRRLSPDPLPPPSAAARLVSLRRGAAA